MRWLGPGRGLLASAALGGLVSSTAVTVSFAGRTRDNPALAPVAAGAIAIASTVMAARVAVLVAIVAPSLFAHVAIPAGGAVIGGVLGGLLVYRRVEVESGGAVAVKNPFELGSAIRFGLVFGAILIATKAAKVLLGDRGLYLASAMGGSTDVDAVTLSTAQLSHDTITAGVATTAIVIAVAVNTLVKSTLALVLGTRGLGKRAFAIGALIIAGAAAGLAVSFALV
jgi:uncharacterized membrane protein (DUF4010 family)